MVAVTKVKQISVESYEQLNQILYDMQVDELFNIVSVSSPIIQMNGLLLFHVVYHQPIDARPKEVMPDASSNTQQTA